MRRVAGLAVVLGGATAVHASPTTLTAEGGAEADTNVGRVETGPGAEASTLAAGVARLGIKVDHRGKLASGRAALGLAALTRIVADSDAKVENVAFLTGDLRWLRQIGKRAVSAGLGIAYADAVPLSDDIGARTFRNFAVDSLLALRAGGEPDDPTATLTFAVGARRFDYKPDRDAIAELDDFDWTGPAASARLDLSLWQAPDGVRSLELEATLAAELRAYDGTALVNTCPEGNPPSPSCSAGTSLPRRDRYQRAAVEVTWTGDFVAAAGYQLTVVDSNSYGQSLVRHKATLSATRELPWDLFGTALATLQFDQYLDGLVVKKDLQSATFTSIDDENRSSLQLRLARQITPEWSIETRAAMWRDLGDSMTEFRRELVYVGAVYQR